MPCHADFLGSGPERERFARRLLHWFVQRGRDLPWRRTRHPYAILVSEFMLQQTQVATVRPYYERWLRRFPDFQTLARASEDDVLHAWQGLGYYSRAHNLHAAAKIVLAKFGGRLPQITDAIATLPGVGRYTANAIASFAFDQRAPVVEANIARVIARLCDLRIPIDTGAGRSALWEKAAQLLPQRHVRDHNFALMDLGATICVARNPHCEMCPVHRFCHATGPHLLPNKKSAPPLIHLTEHHGFVLSRGRILLEKSSKRWKGMWMLPRLSAGQGKRKPLHASQFPFTHHRVTLKIFSVSRSIPTKKSSVRWFDFDSLNQIAMPSPHRRAVEQLVETQKLCSSFAKA